MIEEEFSKLLDKSWSDEDRLLISNIMNGEWDNQFNEEQLEMVKKTSFLLNNKIFIIHSTLQNFILKNAILMLFINLTNATSSFKRFLRYHKTQFTFTILRH